MFNWSILYKQKRAHILSAHISSTQFKNSTPKLNDFSWNCLIFFFFNMCFLFYRRITFLFQTNLNAKILWDGARFKTPGQSTHRLERELYRPFLFKMPFQNASSPELEGVAAPGWWTHSFVWKQCILPSFRLTPQAHQTQIHGNIQIPLLTPFPCLSSSFFLFIIIF